jgi:hypothetical protein
MQERKKEKKNLLINRPLDPVIILRALLLTLIITAVQQYALRNMNVIIYSVVDFSFHILTWSSFVS